MTDKSPYNPQYNGTTAFKFQLGEGYRTLHRKLKGNWKVLNNAGDSGISYETLSQVCRVECRKNIYMYM